MIVNEYIITASPHVSLFGQTQDWMLLFLCALDLVNIFINGHLAKQNAVSSSFWVGFIQTGEDHRRKESVLLKNKKISSRKP